MANWAVVYAFSRQYTKSVHGSREPAGNFDQLIKAEKGSLPPVMVSRSRSMSNAQTSELSEGAAASNASSSSCKSRADWQKYYDLPVRRRDLALKPGNKSHSAAWWNFFEVVLVRDPFTGTAANLEVYPM